MRALLSIFPAIAAFVSLYGLMGDPGKIQGYLDTMKDVLPGGAIEVISDQVKRIASKGGGALGLGLIIGLATALWSANAGVKAMFDALNIVYEAEEKRSFFALNLRSLAFTAPLPVRAVSRHGTVAMDHSRECDSRVPVAPRFGWFLLVRRQLRVL